MVSSSRLVDVTQLQNHAHVDKAGTVSTTLRPSKHSSSAPTTVLQLANLSKLHGRDGSWYPCCLPRQFIQHGCSTYGPTGMHKQASCVWCKQMLCKDSHHWWYYTSATCLEQGHGQSPHQPGNMTWDQTHVMEDAQNLASNIRNSPPGQVPMLTVLSAQHTAAGALQAVPTSSNISQPFITTQRSACSLATSKPPTGSCTLLHQQYNIGHDGILQASSYTWPHP
jgi:hypothetical protein